MKIIAILLIIISILKLGVLSTPHMIQVIKEQDTNNSFAVLMAIDGLIGLISGFFILSIL